METKLTFNETAENVTPFISNQVLNYKKEEVLFWKVNEVNFLPFGDL